MMIDRYFGDDLYPNIETVLSFFSADPLDDLGIAFELRPYLYKQLVDLVVFSLNAASSVVDTHAEGAWSVYYRFVEHLVRTESIVITFNYDLLLEKLLLETKQWHMFDGYGIDIPLAIQALPTARFDKLRGTEVLPINKSKVLLIKLHGSINWGVPTIKVEKGDVIYRMPSGRASSMAYRQVRAESNLPLTIHFEPVIVPPIVDKSEWLRNQTFKYLWNIANQAMQEAKEIIFIGYSLPPTDFMTEFMFRQTKVGSTQKTTTVINPNASDLRDRYANIFGPNIVTIDKRFQTWFVESESYSNR